MTSASSVKQIYPDLPRAQPIKKFRGWRERSTPIAATQVMCTVINEHMEASGRACDGLRKPLRHHQSKCTCLEMQSLATHEY